MNLKGKVCTASNGDIGIPFKQCIYQGVCFWEGVGLHGDIWRSRNPKVIAHSIQEYIELIQKVPTLK